MPYRHDVLKHVRVVIVLFDVLEQTFNTRSSVKINTRSRLYIHIFLHASLTSMHLLLSTTEISHIALAKAL